MTTLERHVARLRSRVEERAWSMLVAAASPESRSKLEALLLIQDGGHQSLLDRLRKGPYRRSAPELVRALERVEEVRRLGITLSTPTASPRVGYMHWRDLPTLPRSASFVGSRNPAGWRRWWRLPAILKRLHWMMHWTSWTF